MVLIIEIILFAVIAGLTLVFGLGFTKIKMPLWRYAIIDGIVEPILYVRYIYGNIK